MAEIDSLSDNCQVRLFIQSLFGFSKGHVSAGFDGQLELILDQGVRGVMGQRRLEDIFGDVRKAGDVAECVKDSLAHLVKHDFLSLIHLFGKILRFSLILTKKVVLLEHHFLH